MPDLLDFGMPQISALLQSHHKVIRAWLSLLFLLSLATLSAAYLSSYVSLTSQAMLYVLVVAIAAHMLDRLQSIVGAVISVLLLNFFFVPPTWTLHVDQSEHLIALGTMLIVALTINQLTMRLKQKTAIAHLNEHRAHQLQELAIRLTMTETEKDIMVAGQQAFEQAFSEPSCLVRAIDVADTTAHPDLRRQQLQGLQHCIKEMQALGDGSLRWSELDDWYLPIGKSNQKFGAVWVQVALRGDTDGHKHAQALCSLLEQGFERLQMNAAMRSAQLETQKQQLQNTFLAAISHDLRTPLAVMVGAASALQSQRELLTREQQDRMLQSLVDEANYLTNVAENTLQLVRLKQMTRATESDWESIEEIIGAVLARIKLGRNERRLRTTLEKNLPLVRIDPVLIAQLLSNLIHNALSYSEDIVELQVNTAKHDGAHCLQIAVLDRGPGIPEAEHERIFDAYSRLGQHDQAHQRSAG